MSAITLNNYNYEKIIKSRTPVLIDFWASWCDSCLNQLPVIEDFSDEMKGSAVIAELNIEENPEIASHYAIENIPALLLLKRGKVILRRNGYTPRKKLRSIVNSVIPLYR